MKKLLAIMLVLALFATLLLACEKDEKIENDDSSTSTNGTQSNAPTDESQPDSNYEIGMQHKMDENYEEAILAFRAAIEEDDSGFASLSYLQLADIYIRKTEYQNAYDVLTEGYTATEDASLKSKLLDFSNANVITDSDGLIRGKSSFENEALVWYHVYTYDTAESTRTAITQYDGENTQIAHIDFTYNENGQPLTSYAYYTENGNIEKVEFEYNENGQLSKTTEYDADGTLSGYSVNNFDEDGYKIGETRYYADGSQHWSLQYTHNVEEKSSECLVYFYGVQVGTVSGTYSDFGYRQSGSSRFKGIYDRDIQYDFDYVGHHERTETLSGDVSGARIVCYNAPLSILY